MSPAQATSLTPLPQQVGAPIEPNFFVSPACYDAGTPQVAWTRLVADLETPVSAMLKIAQERPKSFLLESVEGGAVRGRYSIIGCEPDLIWRANGARAEVNRAPQAEATAFAPSPLPALQSLSALLAEFAISLPPALPPMAAGIFGYMGYDTVRLIEHLPATSRDCSVFRQHSRAADADRHLRRGEGRNDGGDAGQADAGRQRQGGL